MSRISFNIYRRGEWIDWPWMIIVGLVIVTWGSILVNNFKLSKTESFRITVPGLDTKELSVLESLTRCLGKLGKLPRKTGHPRVK